MRVPRLALLFSAYTLLQAHAIFANTGRIVFDCKEILSGWGQEVSRPRLVISRATPPSADPIARVILVHGIKEYSRWHYSTIQGLSTRGIEVVSFDLRGSGYSEGLPQYIHRFRDYVEDVRSVVDWTHINLPPLPLFLLGHSMGGTIAIHYAASHPPELNGLLLTAPAYLPGQGISPVKMIAARVLSTFLPQFRIWDALSRGTLSRDPNVEEEKYNDPLVYRFNTARQGAEVLAAMSRLPEIVRRISIPVIIAHGSADRLIQPEGSRELHTLFRSPDRTLLEIQNGMHEIQNDLDREYLFDEIANWLSSHVRH